MNPYRVLGVKKKATQEEIKRAFLNLAKKHHPDIGGDEEAFKKIKEAYDILKSDDDRTFYDQYGFTRGSKTALYHSDFVDLLKIHILNQVERNELVSIDIIQRKLRSQISDLENEKGIIENLIKHTKVQKTIIRPIKKEKIDCFQEAHNDVLAYFKAKLKNNLETTKKLKALLRLACKYETIIDFNAPELRNNRQYFRPVKIMTYKL
jgi:curved DNA-binding protein CbpA